MPEQPNNSAIKVAEGVRATANEDGAVLLDIEQGLCFSLNPVGSRIWTMIKEGRSVDEIADALEQKFRVPRTQLLTDISDFLKQLEKMHLVSEPSSSVDKRGRFSRLFGRRRRSA